MSDLLADIEMLGDHRTRGRGGLASRVRRDVETLQAELAASQAEAARLRETAERIARLLRGGVTLTQSDRRAFYDALAAPNPTAERGATLLAVVAAATEFWEAELEATAEHVIDPNNEEAELRCWRRIAAARERLDVNVRALRALDEVQP